MAKVKYYDIVTPVVTASFIKINGVVDTYMGSRKYTATAKMKEEDAKALQEKLLEIWKQSPEYVERDNDGKEVDRPNLGISFSKTYGYQIKASTLTQFKDKDGNYRENIVKLVDGEQTPIDPKTKIWDGSKISLWVAAKTYTGPTGYGVSLKLRGIQVLELVSGGGSVFGGSAAGDVITVEQNTEDIPF